MASVEVGHKASEVVAGMASAEWNGRKPSDRRGECTACVLGVEGKARLAHVGCVRGGEGKARFGNGHVRCKESLLRSRLVLGGDRTKYNLQDRRSRGTSRKMGEACEAMGTRLVAYYICACHNDVRRTMGYWPWTGAEGGGCLESMVGVPG